VKCGYGAVIHADARGLLAIIGVSGTSGDKGLNEDRWPAGGATLLVVGVAADVERRHRPGAGPATVPWGGRYRWARARTDWGGELVSRGWWLPAASDATDTRAGARETRV
jgi:hypothetical protein